MIEAIPLPYGQAPTGRLLRTGSYGHAYTGWLLRTESYGQAPAGRLIRAGPGLLCYWVTFHTAKLRKMI